MKVTTRNFLQLPYLAARTPLAVFDAKLVKRLPADSPPRLAFERVVGSLDSVAGRLLHDRSVESQGTAARERADTLSQAVRLERDAAERRQAADETLTEAGEQAGSLREEAERQQREGVHEAVETERKQKQAASGQARVQADRAKERAEARAANKVAAVDERRKQTEARAGARRQRAAAQAKSELGDAAEKRGAARNRRADADRLGELADAKRQARTNS